MSDSQAMFLIPIAGPPIGPLTLQPRHGGLVLGRGERCDLLLPPEHAQKVSRRHARLSHTLNHWRLLDLGSRWGTYLNGVRVEPDRDIRLNEGDLIRIAPWTFSFTSSASPRGVQSADDLGRTAITVVPSGASAGDMHDDHLSVLLESAAAIHEAKGIQALAACVMDAALRGTGLRNAAVLRPVGANGEVEVIASRTSDPISPSEPLTFSRALICAAARGQAAQISDETSDLPTQSMVRLKINAAICTPLMLGGSPAALLYLDARCDSMRPPRPHAIAFCVALSRIAGLALANLQRIDLECRHAETRAELEAAAVAQKWILPARETSFSRCQVIGESRPGKYLGGDFFDVIDLGEDHVAVVLGDVSGHSIAASVLMTATQGFLHATLRKEDDPAAALRALNQFVEPRREGGIFITMWLGIFDFQTGELRYVDAGHGYAMIRDPDGKITSVNAGDCVPIGCLPEFEYAFERISLPSTAIVVAVSDGLIEQRMADNDQIDPSEYSEFGLRRVQQIASSTPTSDLVGRLFDSVAAYAGSKHLSDDATAVMVKW